MTQAQQIIWGGITTEHADEMVQFLKSVFGLRSIAEPPGGVLLGMENGGGMFAVFAAGTPHCEHYGHGPVPAFLVESVAETAKELEAMGVEIVSGPQSSERGLTWVDFRAPDGHIYGALKDDSNLIAGPRTTTLPTTVAHKLGWLGIRTEHHEEMVNLFEKVFGLRRIAEPPGAVLFALSDSSKVEVFSPEAPDSDQYCYGPVPAFLVDDAREAAKSLQAAGIEIIYGPKSTGTGIVWVDFRAPDGHIYAAIEDASVVRPARSNAQLA